MKIKIRDIAVFESRTVNAAHETGSSTATKNMRGWWLRGPGEDRFLGANFNEAADYLQINGYRGCYGPELRIMKK